MRMTLCEVHEKQANALGKTHVSFACPFCLIDSSVKAESQLALAREGLEKIVKVPRHNFNGERIWSTSQISFSEEQNIAQQTLAKLAQAKLGDSK
jgi:hypothetical protein